MKRILALILTLLMVFFAFASCTLNDSKETEKETKKQTEKETEPEADADNNDDIVFEDNAGSNNNNANNNANNNTNENNNGNKTEDDTSEKAYTRNGNKITFGSYPQSKVTDEALVATLNAKAGTLPTMDNKQAWTSYGYYMLGSNETDFTWYIDITEGGEKYRGVYFIAYRPYYTTGISADGSNQAVNGYYVSTENEANVYWFKYEPISWTILNENATDKTALILCDMIIDAQEYYSDSSDRIIDGKTVSPNNYEHSSIRKWLNKTFYETAFDELQKAIIAETTVKNDLASTAMPINPYTSNDTQDKVFLLSCEEMTNEDYKLGTTVSIMKKTTDYAQAQNAYTRHNDNEYTGTGYWWLRTPYSDDACRAFNAGFSGSISDYTVYYAREGVAPALQIKLD